MKTICIDGFNIALEQGSGIATYGRNLARTIRSLDLNAQVLFGPPNALGRDNVLNEVMLADSLNPAKKAKKTDRFVRTLTSRLGRQAQAVMPSGEVVWPSRGGGKPDADSYWAAEQLFYYAHRSFQAYGVTTPVSFQSDSAPLPDIMHWTATLPLHARKTLNVYTIHDLIPLRLPHTTLENKKSYRELCQDIARRADHIAVVSETTRQDVIRLLGVSEDRVTNTYQSVSIPQSLLGRGQREIALELEGIFNLGWKNYFLYFGAIEPKKNLGRIVEAYLASGSQKPLVIVGGRSWLAAGETALLDQVARDGGPNAARIRRYDYMPFSMLVSLIRGARATIFPSLYEGFGLPVLESMLLETAVLTSTAGSLPEVSGDAALTVDPYDSQAITRGIQALDADDDLVENLTTRGRRRAAFFSESAHRERLASLYRGLGVV